MGLGADQLLDVPGLAVILGERHVGTTLSDTTGLFAFYA